MSNVVLYFSGHGRNSGDLVVFADSHSSSAVSSGFTVSVTVAGLYISWERTYDEILPLDRAEER